MRQARTLFVFFLTMCLFFVYFLARSYALPRMTNNVEKKYNTTTNQQTNKQTNKQPNPTKNSVHRSVGCWHSYFPSAGIPRLVQRHGHHLDARCSLLLLVLCHLRGWQAYFGSFQPRRTGGSTHNTRATVGWWYRWIRCLGALLPSGCGQVEDAEQPLL